VAEAYGDLRPLLFSIAYRMLGSIAEAEDIVQEAFLRYQAGNAVLRAVGDGDIARLVELLAADAASYGDGGGKAPSSPRPIFGRERVARLMASLGEACHELGVTLRRTEVNGQPGAMFFDRSGLMVGVITVDVADGLVQTVRSVINPDKLRHLGPTPTRSSASAANAAHATARSRSDHSARQRRACHSEAPDLVSEDVAVLGKREENTMRVFLAGGAVRSAAAAESASVRSARDLPWIYSTSARCARRCSSEGTDNLLAAAREAGVCRFVAQSLASMRNAREGGMVKTRTIRSTPPRCRRCVSPTRRCEISSRRHRGLRDRAALRALLRRRQRGADRAGAQAPIPDRGRGRRLPLLDPPRRRRRGDRARARTTTVPRSTTSSTTSPPRCASGCLSSPRCSARSRPGASRSGSRG
jgi:hypothetical protein